MKKNRGIRSLSIIIMIVAVLGLAVGYAALSQSLSISSSISVKGSTWGIEFDDESLSEATLTGTASEVAAATISNTSITTNVSLTQPNDSATYTFDITNTGSIDAKIGNIILTGQDEATAVNLVQALTYTNDTIVSINDTLAAGETKHIKYKLYLDDTDTVNPTTTTVSTSATIVYVQQ